MAKKRRRQKKTSVVGDIFHFILAVALIVLAVFVVLFVAGKIKDITGSIGTTAQTESTAQSGIEIENTEADDSEGGFTTEADGSVRWKKEDGSFAQDEWIEFRNNLYYFDEDGLMQTGSRGIEGMRCSFDSDGRLRGIRYRRDYTPDRSTVLADYPSLVRDKKFWAFLSETDRLGGFQAIMYKRTTDAMAYRLGGEENPQYTGAYSMQIDGDYIYFLPLLEAGESLSKEEEAINGKLYRMKPGDTVRQIIAEEVDGYKVLNGVIFYESNGILHRTTRAQDDETANTAAVPAEDETLIVEIEDGAAYVTDAEGNPLSAEDGELKGRGFTYYLRDDGTIRGVKEKTTVSTGGYTYYAESDTAFGQVMSRIMRRNADGDREIISAEFPGEIGNIHYNYDTGVMVAEYTDQSGNGRIVLISKSGDVDVLTDSGASAGVLTLLAIQDNQAIAMKQTGGGDAFTELDLSDASPLAVGVDPIAAGNGEETGETDSSSAEISESPGSTAAPESTEAVIAAPDGSTTDAPQAELRAPDQAVVGNAPQ